MARKALDQTSITANSMQSNKGNNLLKKGGLTAVITLLLTQMGTAQTVTPNIIQVFAKSNGQAAQPNESNFSINLDGKIQGYRLPQESDDYRNDALSWYKIFAAMNLDEENLSDESIKDSTEICKFLIGEETLCLAYAYAKHGMVVKVSNTVDGKSFGFHVAEDNKITYLDNVEVNNIKAIADYAKYAVAHIKNGAIAWNDQEAHKANPIAAFEERVLSTLYGPKLSQSTQYMTKLKTLKSLRVSYNSFWVKNEKLRAKEPIDKAAIKNNNNNIEEWEDKIKNTLNEIEDILNNEKLEATK